MSQIAVYTHTSGPGSGTVTSVTGGVGINITGNPAVNPTVNLDVPVTIAHGGTNAITFATTDGTVYFDGTRLVTVASVGSSGQILTSQGAGLPPIFAANAGGSITINGDIGSAAGDPITITGGSSGAIFTGSGSTLTESFNFLALPNSNNTGTIGYISFGGTQYLSNAGTNNVFVGGAGNFTNTSGENIGIGLGALAAMTTAGGGNIAIGFDALNSYTTNVAASENTCVGFAAGFSLLTGTNNICLGSDSGFLLTSSESNNVLISSEGVTGDNNTIRLGDQGTGDNQQNKCFIAGITGVTTSNSQMVTLNSATGQLGSATIPTSAATWSVITVDQSAVINNGYICNKGGLLTLTLPVTAAVGSIIRVTGINTALGWKIAQNSGQTIYFGNQNTTTGATGSLASAAIRDAVEIVCVVANNDFNVLSSIGNITVV